MATISNGSIKLRAMPDGREISSIQVQNNPSSNLQFSPDGKSLAVVSGKTVLLLGIP